MASSTSNWDVFFKEAGIPSKLIKDYSAAFSDHRIRLDMLDELSKELLHDLGITAVGDAIAILRHAKLKYKEMERHHSSSPDKVIEEQPPPKKPKPVQSTTITKKVTVQPKTQPIKNSSIASTSISKPSLRIQTPKTSATTKPREGRKKLSDRFDSIEKETKLKKEEEVAGKIQNEQLTAQPKTQSTVFTVQMSSTSMPKAPTNQKITVVPAQGKPLNRNNQPSSIFDRLEKPGSSVCQLDENILKKKQTVFNRLGRKSADEPQKIQEVPATLRLDTSSSTFVSLASNNTQQQQPTRKSIPTNVFNRLGNK